MGGKKSISKGRSLSKTTKDGERASKTDCITLEGSFVTEVYEKLIPLSFPVYSFYIAALLYAISLVSFFLTRKELAKSTLVLGLAVHTISEISGRFLMWPYCNMFAEPFFLPWCFSAISFILVLSKKEKEGLSIIPLVVIFSAAAILCSEGYFTSFTLKSKSIFSHIFHLFNFIAHACFISGGYLAILTIIKNIHALQLQQGIKIPPNPPLKKGGRLNHSLLIKGKIPANPPLVKGGRGDFPVKEDVSRHLVIWGFAFYCIAGAFGMLWNYLSWLDTISWNHYYFHSVAIWFYYAGFLHLHLLRRWDLKKRAWIILGGALLVLCFDYLPQIGGIHLQGVFDAALY